jgi:sterol desaturase/sphingolipid hydroxylase (fatty acid hydroxylase superfamily)
MELFGFQDTVWRLGISLGILALFVLLELRRPARASFSKGRRWVANIGLLVVDIVAVRLLVPASLTVLALFWQGSGILELLGISGILAWIIAILAFDCLIYWQHRMFHVVPVLWRSHRVHHTDTELDVSTAFRFHPIEILISMGLKAGLIVVLGPPAIAVIVYEIMLNAMAQFNHANWRLPSFMERLARWIVVTPDMHEIHHSTQRSETDSNYGNFLSIWDRIFGSYTQEAAAGQVTIGLPNWTEAEHRIDRLVTQPFRSETRPPQADRQKL